MRGMACSLVHISQIVLRIEVQIGEQAMRIVLQLLA